MPRTPADPAGDSALGAGPTSGGRTPSRDARPRAWPSLAAVVGIPTVLAAVLCLWQLTARSLWLDEAATVAIAGQHGSAFGRAIAHDGGNMAGYYALLHLLTSVFGNGLLVIRLPSALAAATAVALTSLIGIRLFDSRVAFAAGLLTAVSLPLVFWGQDARGYAPMVALVSVSMFAYLALIDRDVEGRPIRWAWAAYVLSTALAIYVSFVAALVVPAQVLALLWRRRRVSTVAGAVCAVVLCSFPLIVLALDRGSGQLFWVPRPNFTAERQASQELSSSGLEPQFHLTATSGVLLAITAVLLVAVIAAIVTQGLRGYHGRHVWAARLPLCWLVVPIALAWGESWLGKPIFQPRNLLMVLPAVGLLVAYAAFGRGLTHPLGWALLAVLLALRALQLVPAYGVSPENWKKATSYVLRGSARGDCAAFYPADGRMAFRYYLGAVGSRLASAPRPVLPAAPWSTTSAYIEDYASPTQGTLARLLAGCPRLWLVTSHVGQPDGPPPSRAHLTRYRLLRASLRREYGALRTASFGFASPVRVDLFTGRAPGRAFGGYGRNVVPMNVRALIPASSAPLVAASHA